MTWECPICGLMNDDARDMCEDCGTPRPAGAAPAPTVPAPAVSAPKVPTTPTPGFAAATAERPAPAVYPATSSMNGASRAQRPFHQQAYQAVPAPAPQAAPMPAPQPAPAPAPQPAPVAMPQPTPVPMAQPAPAPAPMSQPMANTTVVPTVPALTLADPVMGEQLRLTDMAVLGRNAFPSMASNFAMSRQHASVHFEQGTWMVADEGSNNGTALMRGGQILNLVPGVAQPIHTGDTLLIPAASGEFAQLRLTVTVEEPPATQPVQPQTWAVPQSVPASMPVAPVANETAGVEGWFVECPECGRLHLVADERAKVGDGCEECGCSLARTSAVYRTLDPGEDYADVR